MRLILSGVLAILVSAVVFLQVEADDLKAQLAKRGSFDAKAAAAVKQFEVDFFAKPRADEKARIAKEEMERTQRNAALQQGLNWLPTRDMDKRVLWGERN